MYKIKYKTHVIVIVYDKKEFLLITTIKYESSLKYFAVNFGVIIEHERALFFSAKKWYWFILKRHKYI